jgi:MFS family permease
MAAHRPRSRQHWFFLFLPFALGYYLSYLLRNANAVIAPELTRELSLNAAALGLLTSAYFFTFGAVQIPLGILLDRYGPRRIEATLLLIAATGTLLFGLGQQPGQLVLARGLIGLGVSACLMAGLKNFSQWYPAEQQASLAGAIMVAGGLGAISASVPLEMLLPLLGWRGVFLALTAIILLAAAFLFFAVPDHDDGISRATLAQQWQGVVQIFSSRDFWRFAPQTMLFSGGFMAVQGLWAVPWFMNVEGLTRSQAAEHLLAISVAMLSSYAFTALFATRLIRRGVTPATLLGIFLTTGWLCEVAIVSNLAPSLPFWIGFGFFVSATQFAYTAVVQRFALSLSGRVSTALNLMAFVGAFVLQWGFGIVIDLLTARGWEATSAYRIAFALLIGAQLLSWAWFMLEGRREQTVRGAKAIAPAP